MLPTFAVTVPARDRLDRMDHRVEKTQKKEWSDTADLLAGLFAREQDLHNLSSKDEWTVLQTVVDSGAEDTVSALGMAGWTPLTPSQVSTCGYAWKDARAVILANMGERKIQGVTNDGTLVTRYIRWLGPMVDTWKC